MPILQFKPKMPQIELADLLDADYTAMLEVWGNGNARFGFAIFYALTMRLVHARTKHPRYAKDRFEALKVIGSEYDELACAIDHESHDRQLDEARDVIATCVRFLNGEHETNCA